MKRIQFLFLFSLVVMLCFTSNAQSLKGIKWTKDGQAYFVRDDLPICI